MKTLEENLTDYLLGKLSEQERAEIEDGYMADGNLFDRLRVAEDELIDDYVRGRLGARDRSLFEKNFLCVPAHRERLDLARALMTFVDQKAETEPVRKLSRWPRFKEALRFDSPAMRWLLAAGFMLAVLGGPAVVWRLSQMNAQLQSLRAQQQAQQDREQELRAELEKQAQAREALHGDLTQEQRERARLEQELEKLKETQSPQPAAVFSLGAARSPGLPEEAETIPIPGNAKVVRLQMPLFDDAYQNYLVAVNGEDGRTVWQGLLPSAKTAKGYMVSLRLPARSLPAGTYRLTLSGTNDGRNAEVITSYEIKVVRK